MREMRSVAIAEFRCLYALVRRIKYTPIADIVGYFKEICTMSGSIECTSLVTQIALNLGCEEMANVSNIAGDVPILGLSHFVHTHILHEEHDCSISMLYESGSKMLRLPNLTLALHSCEQLTFQLDQMRGAPQLHRSTVHSWACLFGGDMTDSPSAQWDTGYGSNSLEYQGHGSAYHPHDIPRPSHGVGTSATTEFPHWYYPLERYVSYGVDQAQRTVEGIGRVEH
jgi:hypothetical protein